MRSLVALLLASVVAGALANQASGTVAEPEDPPPAERRIGIRQAENDGQGEAGVRVQDVSALTGVSPVGSSGSSRGSGCRWAVVNNPSLWRTDNAANAGAAAEVRALRGESNFVNNGEAWYFTAFLNTESSQLVAAGADETRLRYVQPYGSDACNSADGAWITTAEIEDLALVAFDEVKSRWPAQEITLGWPEPTEDTWTALATGMPWDPISATASNAGLEVTVTATPTIAEWDTGDVNTRIGGVRHVVCDSPGDLPRVQDDASCRVWFAGPSTGLTDRNGQLDAMTLGLTVEWNVGYTSNFAGFANPNWLTWPTESFLDGVIINTTQAVPSASS